VVELKKEYQVTITPADDPRKAAKKLAAIIWKIEHAKKRVPQETILVPGDEETSHAARAVPGSEDAKAHGMKMLEDARRKLEESKKSIFARANREES
jgi:LDH2 family malate/lactate/ureidoglycolate dehydrogenase